MQSNGWKRLAAGTCQALGVIALVLGVLLGYATRSIFNSGTFADHVAASLSEPGVSAFVAGKIADGVIAAKPDLTGLRPLIVAGGRTIVASAPFRVAARRAALEAHRALMSGTGEKILLSVKDVGEILQATLAMHPEVAAKLPPRLTARLASLDEIPGGELTARLVRAARRARIGFLLLMFAGLGLLVAGLAFEHDRRRATFRAGVIVASVACVIWVVATFGGFAIERLPRDPEMGELAAGLWQAFIGGLGNWALGLGLLGLLFAAASTALLQNSFVEARAHSIWRWLVTPPEKRGLQLLRGLALLGLGALAVAWPQPLLRLFTLLFGAVVVFIGLREALGVVLRAVPHPAPRAGEKLHEGVWGPVQVAIAAVLVLAAAAGAAIWVSRMPSERGDSSVITACNGFPELCDRRLDQVVFPTSHNSMGGADISNWMFPNQNKGIPEQLEDGIRGLLIDVHYGMPVGDRVKTIMDNEKSAMAKYEATVGKEGMAAALRIRDRMVGGDEKQKAVYMAHGFCELGATKLTESLKQIREFLVANPGEILIIVIQDEGVLPEDIAKCFEESGLIDFVYRGPARPPWPTLRQMAESDQRVVVMAENNSAGVPWYHQAFEVMQETPYTFHDTTEFSEKPNRGGPGGSLLLMNHWIESTPMPKPSNAEVVNAYDFLLKRARRCQRQRRHVPNLVAVDFYATGDLMRVVQTLNGIKR